MNLGGGGAGEVDTLSPVRGMLQSRQDCLKSRASLVAQLVKNPPAMQQTWVRSLSWEDPLEKAQYSGLKNSMDCGGHGVAKSWT